MIVNIPKLKTKDLWLLALVGAIQMYTALQLPGGTERIVLGCSPLFYVYIYNSCDWFMEKR